MDKKITKCLPGANSLSSLLERGVGAIRSIAAAAGHAAFDPTPQSTGQMPLPPATPRSPAPPKASKPGAAVYARGQILRHGPSGRKVTVVRTSVQASAGVPVHEVVDGKGRKWLAKESDLKPL